MPDAPLQQYEATVRRELALRKGAETPEAALACAVPLPDGRGLLVPLAAAHVSDDELVARLARWRSENASAFATRFHVTAEGTRAWLQSSVIEVDDRIIFLVCDREGRAVGQVGLANALNERREIEVDNVLRGERESPGLMSDALATVTDWARQTLGAARLFLRVLSDNEQAIAFYRRLGWQEDGLQPLVEEDDGERQVLRPACSGEAPDAWFLRMVYGDSNE